MLAIATTAAAHASDLAHRRPPLTEAAAPDCQRDTPRAFSKLCDGPAGMKALGCALSRKW
jgi:hypothetical protein